MMSRSLKLLAVIAFLLAVQFLLSAQADQLDTPLLFDNGNNVIWTGVQEADNYQVRWKVEGGGSTGVKLAASARNYLFNNLPCGIDHTVEVRAGSESADKESSEWSDAIVVSCESKASPAPAGGVKLLDPPTVTVNELTVSWSTVQWANNYQIRWSVGAGEWTQSQVSSPTTSYTFKNLPCGTDHTVEVRAWNEPFPTESSEWVRGSNVRCEPELPTPGPPTNLRNEGFTLLWDGATGAVRYYVVVKRQLPRAAVMTEFVTGTTSDAADNMYDVQYVAQVQSRGDGVNYKVEGYWSNVHYFTVTRPPAPTATATQSPPPEGGEDPPPEGGEDPPPEGGEDPPPKDPPKDPPPPVCQNRRVCVASSGTWTTSFNRIEERREIRGGTNTVCFGREVTRVLQQFTCSNSCPPANASSHNRVISESVGSRGRVAC